MTDEARERTGASAAVQPLQNLLAAWDNKAAKFIGSLEVLGSTTATNLVKEKVQTVREDIENNCADFNKFKSDCTTIFEEHLEGFQVPSAERALKVFFAALFQAFAYLVVCGLILMLAGKIGSVVGIMIVSDYNFTALFKLSACAGVVCGTLGTLSIFSPSSVASASLAYLVSEFSTSSPGPST